MNNRYLIGIAAVVLGMIVWVSIPKSKGNGEIKTSSQRPVNVSAQELYDQAKSLSADNKKMEAKSLLQEIMSDHPDFEQIESIQGELESVNMDIIFTNLDSDNTVAHEVVVGDTLGELAKKYGTTVRLIKKRNNLKSDVIRVGQRLSIWTGTFNVYVDKSQNILLLRLGNEIVKVYSVSTGANNSTPVGNFKITSKLVDPVWFNRGVVVPPESPDNVLGSRWLGFDIPGYGIHGTVDPDKIGQQVTAGCVRMRGPQVEELYEMIPQGSEVKIVD